MARAYNMQNHDELLDTIREYPKEVFPNHKNLR